MNILHIITDLDMGGAETALWRVASGLDPVRFRCRVVSLLPPGPVGEMLRKAGIQVDHLNMRRSRPSPAGLIRLAGMIRSWRPDVVQTWLYHADLTGLLAAKLSLARPKVAWNLRCSRMDLERYSPMTARVVRTCALLSGVPDAIVANSAEARDHHRSLGYKDNRYEVIPNGFDTDLFRPDPEARAAFRSELGVGDAEILVGLAARYDPMKDIPNFLAAMAIVAKEMKSGGKDVRLALMGPDMDEGNRELVGLVSAHGLEERCRLLGPRNDMTALLPGLDLMVSSSRGESFPNVLGEAMACGVVCVATDVGESARLIGETGGTAPAEDAPALAKAILDTFNRPDFNTLGAKARQRIKAEFTLAAALARYENLYTALTS